MDLLQLETFARIVESGSLTGAARATRQSLANVSRQLRALEEDLGVSLVLRTTRKLSITAAGRELHARARSILRDVEEARASLRGGRLRGRLTVSLPVTLGQSLLVPRLGALLRAHPGLELEVRLEDRLTDLIGEAVDLVVRAGTPLPDSADFIAAPLLEFNRVLVASPTFLRAHAAPRTPTALAGLECLLQVAATGPVRRWRLLRAGEEQVVEVRGRISSTAPLVLRETALAGAGVALLPGWLVAEELARKRLRRVLPGWSSPTITAWAMYRKELRAAPAIHAFLEAMRPRATAGKQERSAVHPP